MTEDFGSITEAQLGDANVGGLKGTIKNNGTALTTGAVLVRIFTAGYSNTILSSTHREIGDLATGSNSNGGAYNVGALYAGGMVQSVTFDDKQLNKHCVTNLTLPAGAEMTLNVDVSKSNFGIPGAACKSDS